MTTESGPSPITAEHVGCDVIVTERDGSEHLATIKEYIPLYHTPLDDEARACCRVTPHGDRHGKRQPCYPVDMLRLAPNNTHEHETE